MDSWNLTNKANSHTPKVEIHTRQKLCHFGRYVAKAKLCFLKGFARLPGLECSYGNIFIPVTEISITGPGRLLSYECIEVFTKKRMARRDLGNGASPVDRAHKPA